MKYLYSWLKELYPTISSLDKLESLLIQLGHDVEAITPIAYDGVIVAQIQTIEKHPNADRLSLVTITTGDTTHRVVCGAPHLTIGQKVAYAPVGTTLPCGLTLRPITIRGEESEGMLCAPDELGIGPSHEGLLSLPPEAIIGEPLAQHIPHDAIISLDITSNRGDVLSHFGLARDIKAGAEQKLLVPSFKTIEYTAATDIQITDIHPDVTAFSLASVTGIPPAPTPLYMQSRLIMLGQKPINLATDITNYLQLEFGQPLHAYDAAKLGSPIQMGVRRAHTDETLQLLNGKSLSLTQQSIVITAQDTPVALAGIMGGETTKVTKQTTDVVFECAGFHAKAITLMARGLNISSESSLRFSRGIDPTLRVAVLKHAQYLLTQISGGTPHSPIEKQNNTRTTSIKTSLTFDQVTRLVGSSIPPEQIQMILESLGCNVETREGGLDITTATWRFDLAQSADYIEEIIRVIGLHTLAKQPLSASVPQWKRSKYWRGEWLKDIMVNLGAHEIISYPFVSGEELAAFGHTSAVELRLAPLEGKSFMRPFLIAGSLAAVATNPEAPSLVLFEIARTYQKSDEIETLCIVIASTSESENDQWWQSFFERLRLPVSSWMGRVKEVSEPLRQSYKIRKSCVSYLEIPLDEIVGQKAGDIPTVVIPDLDDINYMPLSKFQSSRRDIAFIVDKQHTPDTLSQEIRHIHPYIIDTELFDTYTNNKIGDDNHSLAYHIVYQAPDRTLTAEEIQTIHTLIETMLKERYHATIR